jgi:hypothetical protein
MYKCYYCGIEESSLQSIIEHCKLLHGEETLKYRHIRVIAKLPNSEQSYKGKVKTHNYINRQNQSTTGKL